MSLKQNNYAYFFSSMYIFHKFITKISEYIYPDTIQVFKHNSKGIPPIKYSNSVQRSKQCNEIHLYNTYQLSMCPHGLKKKKSNFCNILWTICYKGRYPYQKIKRLRLQNTFHISTSVQIQYFFLNSYHVYITSM